MRSLPSCAALLGESALAQCLMMHCDPALGAPAARVEGGKMVTVGGAWRARASAASDAAAAAAALALEAQRHHHHAYLARLPPVARRRLRLAALNTLALLAEPLAPALLALPQDAAARTLAACLRANVDLLGSAHAPEGGALSVTQAIKAARLARPQRGRSGFGEDDSSGEEFPEASEGAAPGGSSSSSSSRGAGRGGSPGS